MAKKLALTELGKIMIEAAGLEACRLAYGSTDPMFIALAALDYQDINPDGTLN